MAPTCRVVCSAWIIYMGRRPLPGNWTKGESFKSAKDLKKRMPELLIGTCVECDTWCAYDPGDQPVHPLCADNPRRKPKQQQSETLFY